MFDARSILDILVRGGGQPQGQGQQTDAGVFRDLLGQLGAQGAPQSGGRRPLPDMEPQDPPRGRWAQRGDAQDPRGGQSAPAPAGGGGNLEDLLRSILAGGQAAPGGGGQSAPGGGNLQDILRDLLGGGPGGGGRPQLSRMHGEGTQGQGGEGGVLDVLRQALGQATAGVREGAGRLDQATGASGQARDGIGQATGQTPEELIAKLKELVANNQLGTGAALGGLGALVLGTGAGRSLAASAIKLGGLALIGGLAYKAYQSYQQGQPVLAGNKPAAPQALVPAPNGSGFEAGAVTHQSATRYIRAMIAAAAADGRIDAQEQQKILGGLKQAGIEQAAQQFLTREINNPATAEDLAVGVASPEEAVQVYTAARIAIDVDTEEEHAFLTALAETLGIDDGLAAQVDAAARGTAA